MKRLLLWFLMLNKRLYKKITYLGILLLIPLMVFVFSIAAQEPSGIATIIIGREDPNDPVTAGIVEQLKSEAIVLSIQEAAPNQALEQVKAGKADAAWIFPADMQGKLRAFVNEEDNSTEFIKVVEREQTVVLRLAREKLSGAVFERVAKMMYLDKVRDNLPEMKDKPDQEILAYMDKTGVTGELFAFYDIYGNVREESGNYLTTPLRGMLAILATISAVVTAMYYQKDQERGIFALLPERTRIFGELGYQMISSVNILAFVMIALFSAGLNVALWHELVLFILFSLCCALFGMAVRTVFGGGRILAVLIPILALVMFVVCPVFFDIAELQKIQLLFPPTYYVTGAYNYMYLLYMVLYSLVLALICGVGLLLRGNLSGMFRQAKPARNLPKRGSNMPQDLEKYETISMEMWEAMVETDIPVMMYTRGISMWPLLRADGDHVRMVHPRRELKKGDIVTFRRADGKEVTHRICKLKEEMFQTLGDNCDRRDEPVSKSSLLGLVTHVSHKGHLIHVDTKFWRGYGRVMIATMPVRMFIRNYLFRPPRKLLWWLIKGRKKARK